MIFTKNIGVFYQHLPPDPFGTSLRGKAFIEAFSNNSFNLDVFTTTYPTTISVNNINLKVHKSFLNARSSSTLVRLFSELVLGISFFFKILFSKKYDLFVVSSPSYIASICIVVSLWIRRTNYIYDVRDIYPEALSYSGVLRDGSMAYRLFTRITKCIYKKSFMVLAATQGLKNKISQTEPSCQVLLAYNGFPMDFLNIKITKFKRFTLCFHGTLGYFQDIELLIRLAREVDSFGIDIIVIGNGRKRFLFDSSLPSNLTYMGGMSSNETINLVSRCHVGLCFRTNDPLSIDSFPIKAWEYLGLGLPSLITPISEAGSFMVDRGCGFQFTGEHIQPIVSKIIAMSDDDTLYSQMVDNLIKVRKEFTRENLAHFAVKTIFHKLESGFQ